MRNETAVRIGTEIKYRRLKLGLTQTQLAEMLGVTQGYIASIEQGRKDSSVGTLAPVLKALGLKLVVVEE